MAKATMAAAAATAAAMVAGNVYVGYGEDDNVGSGHVPSNDENAYHRRCCILRGLASW